MRLSALLVSAQVTKAPQTDKIVTAVIVSFVALLTVLYMTAIARTYREARGGWKNIDRDVLVVLLLVVPLFRAAIRALLWVDRLFYTPKVERIANLTNSRHT